MDTRNWTPILDGKIYCSAACGCKCTKEAYDKAHTDGDTLVNRLGTDDWEVRVWENMGWHYEARHKRETVSISESTYSDGTTYRCYYNGPVQQLGKADTPRAAFNEAVNNMRELLSAITESLESVE